MDENGLLEKPRKAPPEMPRSRLYSLTKLLGQLAEMSEGRAGVPELADALLGAFDGDAMMLYDARSSGLADAIDGDPFFELGGYNARCDLICDVLNCSFWRNPEATIGHIPAALVMVLREDAWLIAQRLWDLFFPDDKKSAEEFRLKFGTGSPDGDHSLKVSPLGSHELSAQSQVEKRDHGAEALPVSVIGLAVTVAPGDTSLAEHAGPLQPVPRFRAQEAAILAKLLEPGFNPKAIPQPTKLGGASPVKRRVNAELGFTRDVMKKAWQRLRDDGSILDAPQ